MTRIVIADYPGAQRAAVLGLQDLLQVTDGYLPQDIAPQERLQVSITNTFQAAQTGDFDIVILPPGLMGLPESGLKRQVADWIAAQHTKGALICSICVGAFFVAEAGLLNGRHATTHWELASAFRDAYPDILVEEEKLIVDEGDVITAGGMMAWADLGLLLIARFLSPAVMMKTAKLFLIDTGVREQSYYNLFVPDLSHGDARIAKAQQWLWSNYTRQITVTDMAEAARLEKRTFLRRFQKATGLNPTEYLQQLRIAKAREMLELTQHSVGTIAKDVGYFDIASFGKLFRKIVGLSPGAYRKRFAPEPM